MRDLAVRLALLMLVLAPLPATAEPALHDVIGVAADDTLNLRAGPTVAAPVLGVLAPDARGIEVVAETPDGAWGRINLGETAGWASMRYLAPSADPAWHSPGAHLHCLGTEPFWTLTLGPAAGVQFENLDGLGLDLVAQDRVDGPGLVALRLAGRQVSGLAGLAALPCSDGMSDRAFGIRIRLGLAADGGPPVAYSGCCTQRP